MRETARIAVERDDAMLCEPVRLEFLRGVPNAHYAAVERFLTTVPLLSTPATLWADALRFARDCHRKGHPVSSMDTVIVAICVHHGAELITFDRGFEPLAKIGQFRLTVLPRIP